MLMLEQGRGSGLGGDDLVVPATILVIGSAAAIMVLRMWRTTPGESLTGRRAEPTIEDGPGIERGETL
jgi:hypothetical protein